MRRVSCLIAVLAAVAGLRARAAMPAEELKTLRSAFDNDLLEILMASDQARNAVKIRYEAGLQNIEAARQQAGDLEGLLEVRKERKRFQAEKTFTAELTEGSNSNIIALLRGCQRAEQEADAERSRRILARLDKYRTRLDARKRALTVADDVDGAVLFNEEMNRAALLPEVQAAKDQVSAAAALAKTEPGEAPPASTKIDKRFKVYTGRNAPAPAVDLKRATLRPTKLSSLASKVIVTAQLGSDSNVKRSTSRARYSSTTTKAGSVATHLRLDLRPRTTTETLENVRVCVQYYVKGVAGTQGKERPRQYRAERLALPAVDAAGATIDFPPVSVSQRRTSFRGVDASSSSGAGDEFFGVLITVFDSDNSIEFQAASASSLDDCGGTALEEIKKPSREQQLEEARQAFSEARAEYARNSADGAAQRRLQEARQRLNSVQESLGSE